MIKRTITETICEYDKERKLVRKTVTETKEEEDNTTLTYPYSNYPSLTNPCNPLDPYQPYCTFANGTTQTNTTIKDDKPESQKVLEMLRGISIEN